MSSTQEKSPTAVVEDSQEKFLSRVQTFLTEAAADLQPITEHFDELVRASTESVEKLRQEHAQEIARIRQDAETAAQEAAGEAAKRQHDAVEEAHDEYSQALRRSEAKHAEELRKQSDDHAREMSTLRTRLEKEAASARAEQAQAFEAVLSERLDEERANHSARVVVLERQRLDEVRALENTIRGIGAASLALAPEGKPLDDVSLDTSVAPEIEELLFPSQQSLADVTAVRAEAEKIIRLVAEDNPTISLAAAVDLIGAALTGRVSQGLPIPMMVSLV